MAKNNYFYTGEDPNEPKPGKPVYKTYAVKKVEKQVDIPQERTPRYPKINKVAPKGIANPFGLNDKIYAIPRLTKEQANKWKK